MCTLQLNRRSYFKNLVVSIMQLLAFGIVQENKTEKWLLFVQNKSRAILGLDYQCYIIFGQEVLNLLLQIVGYKIHKKI